MERPHFAFPFAASKGVIALLHEAKKMTRAIRAKIVLLLFFMPSVFMCTNKETKIAV